jgi:hypothetical protein
MALEAVGLQFVTPPIAHGRDEVPEVIAAPAAAERLDRLARLVEGRGRSIADDEVALCPFDNVADRRAFEGSRLESTHLEDE